jgi:phosphatidylserine/phosphatidylglycerophosphate/cardiolipin synthase-like enzyme
MATLRGGHRCFPLGTANLDRRSFFLNYEMMLLLPHPEAARQLADLLRRHVTQSQQVSVARGTSVQRQNTGSRTARSC